MSRGKGPSLGVAPLAASLLVAAYRKDPSLSIEDLCERFGRKPEFVRRHLKKAGIEDFGRPFRGPSPEDLLAAVVESGPVTAASVAILALFATSANPKAAAQTALHRLAKAGKLEVFRTPNHRGGRRLVHWRIPEKG